MAKSKNYFVCRQCGAMQSKWMGKCPECDAWDSLEETFTANDSHRPKVLSAGGPATVDVDLPALPVSQIPDINTPRMATGLTEFDRVIGGGVVPGAAILLGGDPGIGKSTLLLQVGQHLAAQGLKVLYVSSEESAPQTRMRATRLGASSDNLLVYAQTNVDKIGEQIQKLRPHLCIVDSVQLIYQDANQSAPGSVSQLKDCCTNLVYLAKASGTAVCLVGHVTKRGMLAGPKLIEHIVDTVLYFEGDSYHDHRIVRCIKNRFGSTLEVGLFRMTAGGLEVVDDAASLLIQAGAGSPPGSVLTACLQGSRVLPVEIQALTADSALGAARRKATGCDANRLAMMIAVLEKHAEFRLLDKDVFVNAVGGMKVSDPAVDAAMAMAIAGSHLRRGLPAGSVVVGEIGLLGEFRPVASLAQRINEVCRLGYRQLISGPIRSAADRQAVDSANGRLTVHVCKNIDSALALLG
jgi:DNA repair protein RadA/Sms